MLIQQGYCLKTFLYTLGKNKNTTPDAKLQESLENIKNAHQSEKNHR